MKTQKIISLTGYTAENIPATPQNADQVTYFRNAKNTLHAIVMDTGLICIQTQKDHYILNPHDSIENLFTGVLNGIKVHFTKKKLVGKLMYWSEDKH